MAFSGTNLRPVDVQAFTFDEFRLDPATRELLRGGQPVPLAPRTFDLLLTLVENRHRVVDKDELLRRVWSDAVVEESNLTQQVFVLRKALGDSQDAPRFVATVPRRGYRFVGDARDASPVAARRPQPVAAPAVAAWRPPAWAMWTGAAIVVLAIGGMVAQVVGRSAPTRPATFHRLTFEGRGIDRARFTPDGRSVVLAARWHDRGNELYVTPADAPAARSIGVDGARVLRVSAAGDVAVLLDGATPDDVALAKVPLTGGGPRKILDGVRAADWAPELDRFAVVRLSGGRTRLEYPAGTLLYEMSGWIDGIKISPDRSRVAFLEHPALKDTRGFLTVVDQKGQRRVLTQEWGAMFGAAWTPDGREIWFGKFDGHTYAIGAADLAGHERDVYRGPSGLIVQDIFRDGRLLATGFNLQTGVRWRPAGAADERALSMFSLTRAAAIDARGDAILFTVEDQGADWTSYATYLQTASGPGPIRLGEGSAQGLSPDGRWALAIVHSRPGRIVLLPTGAGQARTVAQGAIVQFHAAQFLPDGERVVFAGNETGKGVRLYVQSIVSDGAPRPITPEGYTFDPNGVSMDGQFVICLPQQGEPARCPVGGGPIEPLRGIETGERAVRWNVDGRTLYVFRTDRFPLKIVAVDSLTGRRTAWRDIAPPDPGSLREVAHVLMTADGEGYAYNYNRMPNDLYLIEGLK